MVFLPTVHLPNNEYVIMLGLMRDEVWGLAFAINGFALMYGVLRRTYNLYLLWMEGILGTASWIAAAFCMTLAQRCARGVSMCRLIAAWILYRYPTHLGKEDALDATTVGTGLGALVACLTGAVLWFRNNKVSDAKADASVAANYADTVSWHGQAEEIKSPA